MQIPGQKCPVPTARRFERRENALKLCFRTRSVNDQICFDIPESARRDEPSGGSSRGRRSGSRSIYEIKRQAYEAARSLNDIDLRKAPNSGAAEPGRAGGSAKRPVRRDDYQRGVRVVRRLVNFRAVHQPWTRVLCPSGSEAHAAAEASRTPPSSRALAYPSVQPIDIPTLR